MPIIRSGYATRRNTDSYARAKARKHILMFADRCDICGLPPTDNDPLEADHIIPGSRGGSDAHSNLRPAHRSCNRKRGQG